MLYSQFYFDILNNTIERFYYPNYFWSIVGFVFFTLLAIFIPREKAKKSNKKSKYQYHTSTKKENKKRINKNLCFRCCIFAFAIVLGIGGIIYTNIEINKIKRDIENKNFIIYTGTFEYRYRGVHSSYDIAVVDFLDANRKVTDTVHFLDRYNIYSTYEKDHFQSPDEGIYQGSVIYSKESKIVVELQIVKKEV